MNDKKKSEEDYVPFSPEWENYLTILPKPFLIEMIRKEGLQRQAEVLSKKERALIAFAIFTTGMRLGPTAFAALANIVKKIGITEEFVDYAKDWIGYVDRKKKENI